jgi:hypothetical protein
MQRLNPGDPFPILAAVTVAGRTMALPADLATPYGILLTYRAHW